MLDKLNTVYGTVYQVVQERDESISDHLICIEGVLNGIKMKFLTQMTETESDQLLRSRFYSGLCSQIWDGLRDMFRNSAYDITGLMKPAQDLKDEHGLDMGSGKWLLKWPLWGTRGKCPQDWR